MINTATRILNWLLVMWIGFEMGAGVYEARVVLPIYTSSLPESLFRLRNAGIDLHVGRNFWEFSSPELGLLALITLVLSFFVQARGTAWLKTGSAVVVLVVLWTELWFVPNLIVLIYRGQGLSSAELTNRALLWVHLNWVRVAVYASGWLCVIRAAMRNEQSLGQATPQREIPLEA